MENTRENINYSDKDIEILKLQKKSFLIDIEILEKVGDVTIYDNQIETSKVIVDNLKNKKIINQLILGKHNLVKLAQC
jgi:hypothetical protein